MSPRNKSFKNNIVIVCEGNETENYYFKEVKKNSTGIWSDIKIIPEPLKEKVVRATSRRPKKSFIGGNKKEKTYLTQVDTPENYEKYKAQPTKYVREAQLFAENEGYSDVWAVFDKDQHPNHADAFILANTAGVKIAFSSLAFETWILSHFEKSLIPFDKVECKDNENKSFSCGTGHITCKEGERCLCGYIRSIHYPAYEKNKHDIFYDLKCRLNYAYENSAWLRYIKNNRLNIYQCNPYTDVDCLVKQLLGINQKIQWILYNESIDFDGSQIYLSKNDNTIRIDNIGSKTIVIKDHFYWCDEYETNKELINMTSNIIAPNSTEVITIHRSQKYLNIYTHNIRYIIKVD